MVIIIVWVPVTVVMPVDVVSVKGDAVGKVSREFMVRTPEEQVSLSEKLMVPFSVDVDVPVVILKLE